MDTLREYLGIDNQVYMIDMIKQRATFERDFTVSSREFEILTSKEIAHIWIPSDCMSYRQTEIDGDVFSFRTRERYHHVFKFINRIRPDLVVSALPTRKYYTLKVNL